MERNPGDTRHIRMLFWIIDTANMQLQVNRCINSQQMHQHPSRDGRETVAHNQLLADILNSIKSALCSRSLQCRSGCTSEAGAWSSMRNRAQTTSMTSVRHVRLRNLL